MKTWIICSMFVFSGATIDITIAQEVSFYGGAGYNVPFSEELAEGITTKGGLNIFFNKYLGIAFDVSYLFEGEKGKFKRDLVGEEILYITSSNLSLSTSIVLQTKMGILIPYLKLGCSINFPKVYLFQNYDYLLLEYYENYSFGLNSSLGSRFMITTKFEIFGEFSISNFTLSTDKVLETYEIDGEKYVREELIYDGLGNTLTESFKFNSLNICIGIVYNL